MNKKISLYVLALGLMASAGVDARRSIRSSGTTASVKSNTVSSSLVSGIGLKYFKNSSITLVENRSVNIEPIMFTNNLTNIQTRSGKDPSFKLCFACDDIVLQYEQGEKLDSNASPYDGLQCYSIPEGSKNIRLTVKPGAIEHCGSRTRMTINDVRAVDKGLAPEVDSVVLNIVKNSSAYDFSNLGFEVDKDILDLVKNYDDAKEKVKKECGKIDMEKLNTIQGLMIASTATSGTSILASGGATGTAAAAAISNKGDDDPLQKGLEIGSIAASGTGAAANLAGSITAFISVGQMNDIISQVQKCRDAGREMHNAGLALETGLEDITSADDI